MAFVFVLQNEVNKSSSSSSSSEGINGLSRDGIRTEYLTSEIVLISPQLMNFNFSQPMKRPCLSFLILQWKKKKTSFGTVDPQDDRCSIR